MALCCVGNFPSSKAPVNFVDPDVARVGGDTIEVGARVNVFDRNRPIQKRNERSITAFIRDFQI